MRLGRLSLRRGGQVGLLLPVLLLSWAQAAPLRVAVISDLNGSYGSTRYPAAVPRAVASIVAGQADLVLSTGDMVAGQRPQPPLEDAALAAMWSAFHRLVTNPLGAAGIPLAITPGNHDASAYPPYRVERDRFAAQWAARRPDVAFVDDAHYPFYYAFALRDVLFVSLDVTRPGRIEQDQRQWLEALLRRAGDRYRHRVAFSHLPLHPFARGREREVSGDLEPARTLAGHGVELYLSGHHHAFYPGYRDGVRFVSQACLGAGPRALLGTTTPAPRAVTWVEFDGAEVRVTALSGPYFRQPIDLAGLPRSVGRGGALLLRDDLRPGAAGQPPP